MNVRSEIGVGLGHFARWGLRAVFRRNASQLPGRIALTVDPDIISRLAEKLQKGSIVVCGTNGKTTTNNIIASAIEAGGQRVLCNRAGANMAPGVVAALLPGSGADWGVIEADELSTVNIVPELKPKLLVLLNLFRDQLDREGEIDRVQDTIVRALASSPETTLLVCGDDPISMGVARRAAEAGTKVLSFGIAEDLHLPPERVPEGAFCQVCGTELVYDYRTYAQLGAFRCPKCGFARPTLDYQATNVHAGRSGVEFDATCITTGDQVHLHANFGGVYMVYNLLAAFAAATMAGVEPKTFQRALDSYSPANGRLQHFDVDGREVVLNLAKNPAGFNQNIQLLLEDKRPKATYIVINDNYNDGRDISWIWDVDFERLAGEGKSLFVLAGGLRANDLQVRFKYAGIDAQIAKNVSAALEAAKDMPKGQPLYVLTNYSALWPAKAELERMAKRHE